MCEGIPHARWALDNEYHITLEFLGEVEKEAVRDITFAAKGVRVQPFNLRLSSAGVFPRKGKPRVLWVGTEAEDQLFSLQRKLQNELRAIGISPEKRKFHPHVTLARLDPNGAREPLSDWLARYIGYKSEPFPVTRFHLLSSTLLPHGSLHRIEQTFPLRR